MIELQWHNVVGNFFHTLIRVTPNDQAYWSRSEFFKRYPKLDAFGKLYFTFGAGPVLQAKFDGNSNELVVLVSDINRTLDSEPHLGKYLQLLIPAKYSNENDFIEKLIISDLNYKDHLDYDFFPSKVGNEVWYIADSEYNSNSYIAGLLIALGVPHLNPPVHVPGFQRPVPARYFK